MKTIQALREERGESTSQLAAAVGVSVHTVDEWEQGAARPSVVSLRALIEHFDVDEADLDLDPCEPPSLSEQVLDALDLQA